MPPKTRNPCQWASNSISWVCRRYPQALQRRASVQDAFSTVVAKGTDTSPPVRRSRCFVHSAGNAVADRKAWANIPPKANRKDPICFSPFLYKARNLVERFFNKAKQFRRIATRYDKLAENYLAAVKLVAIRIWLRGNESTS